MATRKVTVNGELAYVTLTKGYVAVIDVADVALVAPYNWCAHVARKSVYAMRKDGPKSIMLHRFLLGSAAGEEVDHKDGDGLNNRRGNLRPATVHQNQYNQRLKSTNTSGVKGVTWRAKNRTWQAVIQVDGKPKYLGCFKELADAAAAYACASAELHKEFSRLG